MKQGLYRSAAIAALLASGMLAGAGVSTIALAQTESQAEEPPVPMEKVRKKRQAAAECANEAECAAQGDDKKTQRAAEKAAKEADRAAEKAANEAERGAEATERKLRRAKSNKDQVQQQAQEPAAEAGEEPAEDAPARRRVREQAEERPAEEPVREQAEERPAEEPVREQAEERPAEEPVREQAVEEPEVSDQPAVAEEGEGRKRRQRREADGEREPEMTVEEARQELQQPAQVSEQAEKPREIVNESIAEQVEEAARQQAPVIPDNLTREQADQFKNAERRRRERARENRGELLGAAAVGAVIGAMIPQLGGRVQADQGDRLVIDRNGELFVRKDESALLRGGDARIEYERLANGRVRETITRTNGVQIITVKDPGGNMLRRTKVLPNGQRIVLFDFRDDYYDRRRPLRDIPRYRVDIPRDRYIVSARRADRRRLYETFTAEPIYIPQQRYTLQEIREYEPVRSMVRRVDLDTINFAFGSAFVEASQVELLGDIAGGMLDVIDESPETIFLIEGHTDAVGSEIDNLVLSDRRAEAVARILVDAYGVPPENLVTQGYGEEYLKVNTEGPEIANRRATVRNITPILDADAGG